MKVNTYEMLHMKSTKQIINYTTFRVINNSLLDFNGRTKISVPLLLHRIGICVHILSHFYYNQSLSMSMSSCGLHMNTDAAASGLIDTTRVVVGLSAELKP